MKNANAGPPSLEASLAQLGLHDHPCLVYSSREELLDAVVPFLRIGLERGERCLCLGPWPGDEAGPQIVEALRTTGIDVDRLVRSGALTFLSPGQVSLKVGRFGGDDLLGLLADTPARQGQDSPAVRALIEPAGLPHGVIGDEGLREFEARLDACLQSQQVLALCAYDRSQAPAETVLAALYTHPLVIQGGMVCQNPYYVPPKEFLETGQSAQIVQRLLDNLDQSERKQAEERIRQDAQQLEVLARLSSALAEVGTDYQSVLNLVARRAAEAVGDACVLALLSEDGQWVTPVASYHPLPEARKLLEVVLASTPHPVSVGPVGLVVRTGEPLCYPAEGQPPLRGDIPDGYRPFIEKIGMDAMLLTPMRVRGQVIGTLGLTRDRGGKAYRAEDQAFMQELAHLAALSISNARLYEQVRDGRERMQMLSRRLVEAQEAERRSISRELHDEIGQLLTGLHLTLAIAGRPGAEAQASIGDAKKLTEEVMARVRDLSLALRPAMLDDLGLLPALLWLCERYTLKTRVQVNLEHKGIEGQRFAPELETASYRIVQEALTNVARHAQVKHATVRLWAGEGLLRAQVEDHGAGFDPAAALRAGQTGGLAGMRERAGLVGGRLTIESELDRGTRLTAELPLGSMLERRSHRP